MKLSSSLLLIVMFSLLTPAYSAAPQSAKKAKVHRPFNGQDLKGWTFKNPKSRSKWKVGVAEISSENPRALRVAKAGKKSRGELVNAQGRGVDIYSLKKYGDCTIDLEFMVPKGSNSGIYVMGEYEIQILDSYGKKKIGPGDVGALYGASVPKVNAAKRPGVWQTFHIEFRAPRFKDGKKVANARFVKVVLNGKVLHQNVDMKGPTPSGVTGKEAATGPIMFQGDHGPVAYRKIRITVPKK